MGDTNIKISEELQQRLYNFAEWYYGMLDLDETRQFTLNTKHNFPERMLELVGVLMSFYNGTLVKNPKTNQYHDPIKESFYVYVFSRGSSIANIRVSYHEPNTKMRYEIIKNNKKKVNPYLFVDVSKYIGRWKYEDDVNALVNVVSYNLNTKPPIEYVYLDNTKIDIIENVLENIIVFLKSCNYIGVDVGSMDYAWSVSLN